MVEARRRNGRVWRSHLEPGLHGQRTEAPALELHHMDGRGAEALLHLHSGTPHSLHAHETTAVAEWSSER